MTDLGQVFPLAEERTEFTNVSLDTDTPTPEKENKIKKKQPRRILHFSDGILEEYSTDEEEEKEAPVPITNPKTLTWFPWFWYYTATAASKTLKGADFCGEKLAWFFGITTPKYQYAIDEYYRLKEEEERENKRQEKIRQKLEGETLSSIDVKIEYKDTPSEQMPSLNTTEAMEKY